MKYEFRLQLYKAVSSPIEIDFVCTQRQIDKLFYALAFASTTSSIVCGRLYRCTRNKRAGTVKYTSVNTFTTKSAAQMLTNWVAERILLPEGEK